MLRRPLHKDRFKKLRLLILDVDGVMTDGGVYLTEEGGEAKKFNIQDGYGIVKLQRGGVRVALITGRVSAMVTRRAGELGISEVHQNLENKLDAYQVLKTKLGLEDGEIACIGDDEPDLPVIERVGFSAAPADAVDAVQRKVDFVCKRRGGEGAVREVVEIILRNRK